MSQSLAEARPHGPFAPSAPDPDREDAALVRRAVGGETRALETLVHRHQPWVHGLALRMLGDPSAAADCTQDALLRVVTRLSQYRGEALFRTWAYRIVVHVVLDAAKAQKRRARSFDRYRSELQEMGDGELTLPARMEPDRRLLVEETRMRCLSGMLLCLDADQRMAYVLGDVFELEGPDAGALLGVSAATFRKRLERARRDLGRFVFEQCGLVDPSNPCRCPGKTRALLQDGLIHPDRLVFTERSWARAHEAAPTVAASITEAGQRLRRLMRDQPLVDGPDVLGPLKKALGADALKPS